MFRKKRIISIGLAIIVAAIFFFIPGRASAGIISFLAGNVVVAIFMPFLFFLQWAVVGLFSLGALLSNTFLDLNLRILHPGGAGALITTGWTIVRDVANLGFALAIIMIAIAIILRFKEYGSGRLLMKFIAAAIIINFSLTIAAVFIDFSHSLTAFFFNKIKPGNTLDLVTSFSGAFSPQALYTEDQPVPFDPDKEINDITSFAAPILIQMGSILFTIIFIAIAAFVLWVFAGMLFVRYLMLSFLLILFPAVWLFWIIPPLARQFGRWWSKFLQWVFFAPGVAFFFYLVFFSLNKLQSGEGAKIQATAFFQQGFFMNLIQQGGKMLILAGLLIGGLLVAQELSITGAKGAMQLLNQTKQTATKWAGQKAARTASYPLRTGFGRTVTRRLQRLGERRGFIGRTLSRPINILGRQFSNMRMAAERKIMQGIDNRVRSRSIEENARMFNSASNPERVAIIRALRDAEQSNDPHVAARAREAIDSLNANIVNRSEIRLSFLYGGGETPITSGTRRRIEQLIEEELQQRQRQPDG